jgi:hypothetical protein
MAGGTLDQVGCGPQLAGERREVLVQSRSDCPRQRIPPAPGPFLGLGRDHRPSPVVADVAAQDHLSRAHPLVEPRHSTAAALSPVEPIAQAQQHGGRLRQSTVDSLSPRAGVTSGPAQSALEPLDRKELDPSPTRDIHQRP